MMIDVQIGPRKESYLLVKTNAPRTYDSGAAIELADVSYNEVEHINRDTNDNRRENLRPRLKIERYLLIPKGDILWQQGRNASGLHSFETEDLMIDEQAIARKLWHRMGVPNLVSHLQWAVAQLKGIEDFLSADRLTPGNPTSQNLRAAEEALVQAQRS